MNITNLLVDTSILIAFLVVMEPRFSGIAVHEWLSLALATTVVVHLLLHWKWIIGVGARFFKKLWADSRLKFVVDVLLFAAFVAVMLSGILISRSVLPTLGLSVDQASRTWSMLHSLSAYLSILLVGLHFALNWKWVVSMLKRVIVDPLAQLFRPYRAAQPVAIPVAHDDDFKTRGA